MDWVSQEAEEQLQQSYRERARLEKQRAKLEQELASWSSKLGVNMDFSRAESLEPSEPSGSDKVRPLLAACHGCLVETAESHIFM